MNITEFQELVWQKGKELYRDMPWRRDTRPYYVLVSELMLQQTQVERVIPKFEQFVQAFPDVESLAQASLAEVLRHWNGLGYNRRAKYLHDAARMILRDDDGLFPDNLPDLTALPGVGPNTAGAILAYSFNQPVAFVETNVRTVILTHFFADEPEVSDTAIREMVEATVDPEHPREWFWALMDYGTWLKKQGGGRLAQSKHYRKQAPLKGSIREVRGQIVAALTSGHKSRMELELAVMADERFASALAGLMGDGLIELSGDVYHLTETPAAGDNRH